MSDPASTTLPLSQQLDPQQLDPWKESTAETEDEERPEVPEAVLETFFDQSSLVADQAEEYWQEHVLKRQFDDDEEGFRFNEHTHAERKTSIELLTADQTKLEQELGTLDKEKQKIQIQEITRIRERRVQIIMEQASADIAYMLAHRAKIESEVKDLAVNAESQADIEKLKELAEKATQLSSRMNKFEIYSTAALELFKKYQTSADDLSKVIGDGRTDRDQEFMYQMLIAVEKSTGNDYEITGSNDRNFLTTFEDICGGIIKIDHKRLAILIAARVSQLEETAQEKTSDALETKEKTPSAGSPNLTDTQPTPSSVGEAALSFADLQRDGQTEIAKQAQQLDDSDQNSILDSKQGSDGMTVTELPPAGVNLTQTTSEYTTTMTDSTAEPVTTTTDTSMDSDSTITHLPTAEELQQEKQDRDQARATAVKHAIEDVFAPRR